MDNTGKKPAIRIDARRTGKEPSKIVSNDKGTDSGRTSVTNSSRNPATRKINTPVTTKARTPTTTNITTPGATSITTSGTTNITTPGAANRTIQSTTNSNPLATTNSTRAREESLPHITELGPQRREEPIYKVIGDLNVTSNTNFSCTSVANNGAQSRQAHLTPTSARQRPQEDPFCDTIDESKVATEVVCLEGVDELVWTFITQCKQIRLKKLMTTHKVEFVGCPESTGDRYRIKAVFRDGSYNADDLKKVRAMLGVLLDAENKRLKVEAVDGRAASAVAWQIALQEVDIMYSNVLVVQQDDEVLFVGNGDAPSKCKEDFCIMTGQDECQSYEQTKKQSNIKVSGSKNGYPRQSQGPPHTARRQATGKGSTTGHKSTHTTHPTDTTLSPTAHNTQTPTAGLLGKVKAGVAAIAAVAEKIIPPIPTDPSDFYPSMESCTFYR